MTTDHYTEDRRAADHLAPFADVSGEGEDGAAERIARIDETMLHRWFNRFRHYTHPGSYGQCGCERAFEVAFQTFTPDVSMGALAQRVRQRRHELAHGYTLREGCMTDIDRRCLTALLDEHWRTTDRSQPVERLWPNPDYGYRFVPAGGRMVRVEALARHAACNPVATFTIEEAK